LALLTQFKNRDLAIREYRVIGDIPVRQGTVGPLTNRTPPYNESFGGGGQQWEFLVDMRGAGWERFLQPVGSAVTLR
jgi:hypothetical protein